MRQGQSVKGKATGKGTVSKPQAQGRVRRMSRAPCTSRCSSSFFNLSSFSIFRLSLIFDSFCALGVLLASTSLHLAMSLRVDDGHQGRSRSRSRDRRARDETPSEYADVREPSYVYPEDDLDDRARPSRRGEASSASGLPYPVDASSAYGMPGSQSLYSYDSAQPIYKTASPPRESQYRSSREKVETQIPGSFPADERRTQDDDEGRSRYADPRGSRYGRNDRDDDSERRDRYNRPSGSRQDSQGLDDDKLKFLPQKYSRSYADEDISKKDKYSRRYDDGKPSDPEKDARDRQRRRHEEDDLKYSDRDRDRESKKERKKRQDEEDLAYGRPPPSPAPPTQRPGMPETYGSYISSSQAADKRSSRYGDNATGYGSGYNDGAVVHTVQPGGATGDAYGYGDKRDSYLQDPRSSQLSVEPQSRERDRSRDRRRDKSPRPEGLTVDTGSRDRDRSRDRRASGRDKSPQPPTARMSNLSVDGPRPSGLTVAAAPASPLLESYRGTYQDISPMPSPLLMPAPSAGGIEPLSPLSSDAEGDGRKRNRRARFHDPEDIASRLAQALTGSKEPKIEPLIDILPSLTHDQVMELRTEYKRLVKTPDRKGVNIAKHIRSRLKDEDPSLRKACYSVALGMWESEAYWANFWYQGDKTRRELLIESLMGRTNDEIRRIKDAFTDKKYDNSLTKCMKTELKEDKFKKAVLMVLEERRMEEYDSNGRRLPLDYGLVDRDLEDLRKALKAEKGGETLMMSIVIQRSDSHLRAIYEEYERVYRGNFARESLKKSGNLVGELLAHILNGVINRPLRDTLLLHHAITATRKDHLRRELLISRLVRFHWDPRHMHDIRKAYRERYGRELQEAVREATSGEWGLFCTELCIARMPNDRLEQLHLARPHPLRVPGVVVDDALLGRRRLGPLQDLLDRLALLGGPGLQLHLVLEPAQGVPGRAHGYHLEDLVAGEWLANESVESRHLLRLVVVEYVNALVHHDAADLLMLCRLLLLALVLGSSSLLGSGQLGLAVCFGLGFRLGSLLAPAGADQGFRGSPVLLILLLWIVPGLFIWAVIILRLGLLIVFSVKIFLRLVKIIIVVVIGIRPDGFWLFLFVRRAELLGGSWGDIVQSMLYMFRFAFLADSEHEPQA
ncbi:LOW QUALITY PROTEIN: Annexin A11 [Paramyrothecium foliicola]|nr:LOW QUALITY PROTEIN: Annexin A11 [Paramyrothecium foliicola]